MYIEEYQNLPKDANGFLPIVGSLIATQKVTVGASSTQSSAFNAKTNYVVIQVDTGSCQFETGSNPTADGDSRLLVAGQRVPLSVVKEGKIAVIEKQ